MENRNRTEARSSQRVTNNGWRSASGWKKLGPRTASKINATAFHLKILCTGNWPLTLATASVGPVYWCKPGTFCSLFQKHFILARRRGTKLRRRGSSMGFFSDSGVTAGSWSNAVLITRQIDSREKGFSRKSEMPGWFRYRVNSRHMAAAVRVSTESFWRILET
jgi:hypothetical protein